MICHLFPNLLILTFLSTTCSSSDVPTEIPANIQVDPNTPKEQNGEPSVGGQSQNISVKNAGGLDQESQKFLMRVLNHTDQQEYFKAEEKLADMTETTKEKIEEFRQRMRKTADIISNRTQNAKEVARNIIEFYTKDLKKIYAHTKDELLDFLSPLINWFRESIDDITGKNPNKTNHTLAVIQHTIDKKIKQV